MLLNHLIFLATFFAFAGSALAQDPQDLAHLQTAQQALDSGDFENARRELQTVLEHSGLLLQHEKSRLFLLKARTEYAFDGDRGMRPWLEKLYENDHNAQLDPLLDPPSAHTILRELKSSDSLPGAVEQKPVPQISPFGVNETPIKEGAGFWVHAAPFGIGHFQKHEIGKGALFLGCELAAVLGSANIRAQEKEVRRHEDYFPDDESSDSYGRDGDNFYSEDVAIIGFGAAWGYEVLDLLPEMYRRNPEDAEYIRYGLSFFPFGVGQLKNGEPGKAILFAAVEGVFLTGAVRGPSQPSRDTFNALLIASALYGGFDGWFNHTAGDQTVSTLSLLPTYDLKMRTPGLAFRADF